MKTQATRLLLIDDNAGDAELTSEWLALAPSQPFEILHAASLAEGLQRLSHEPVDVVILDLNLPDSRGLSSLDRLRPAAGGAPVIVVSGFVDDLLRSQALAAGADDILSKDEINSRLFSRSVLYVIERRQTLEQHARLERLLDATPDAIVVVNLLGAVLYVNRAAQLLFPGSHSGFFGDLIHRTGVAGKPVEITVPSVDSERLCEMRIAQMNWSGEQASIATVRDITENRRAELQRRRSAELEDKNRRVEAASRMKSEFLANMSHEIRTPMNAVIGLAYLLKSTVLDADQAGLLERMEVASRTLLGLIDNVLDLSKIEAGQLVLEAVDFSLTKLLDDVTHLIRPLAEAKGIALIVKSPPPPLTVLRGDVTRVRQVLVNLMSNAVKFTERGWVELTIELTDPQEGRVMLKCRVLDTGIGIAPQAQGRLFNSFTQADASTTRRYGGSGLGLSIVRRVAELMGGGVGMSSAVGEGSEFWATLGLSVAGDDALHLKGGEAADSFNVLFVGQQMNSPWLQAVRALQWHEEQLDPGHPLLVSLKQRLQDARCLDALIVDHDSLSAEEVHAWNALTREIDSARLPACVVIGQVEPAEAKGAAYLSGPATSERLFAAMRAAIEASGASLRRLAAGTDISATGARWLVGVRLLVVDDSEVNLEVAGRVLRQQGAHVTACSSAGPALEALRGGPGDFDLVLMDVQMPDMDGCEAAQHIRADPALSKLPIIALTAGVLVSERDRAIDAGMDDVICKPFDPTTLVRAVRRHVERAQSRSLALGCREATQAGSQIEWPHLPGIDHEGVRRRLSNDLELFRSLLDRVLRENVTQQCAFDGTPGKRLEVAGRMHRLRGSFGIVGANELQALAHSAEVALTSGADAEEITAILKSLTTGFARLRERVDAAGFLKSSLRLIVQPTVNDGGTALDARAYSGLARALVQQSLSARAQLEALAGPLRRQLGEMQFAALHAAVDRFDFPSAARVLSSLDVTVA